MPSSLACFTIRKDTLTNSLALGADNVECIDVLELIIPFTTIQWGPLMTSHYPTILTFGFGPLKLLNGTPVLVPGTDVAISLYPVQYNCTMLPTILTSTIVQYLYCVPCIPKEHKEYGTSHIMASSRVNVQHSAMSPCPFIFSDRKSKHHLIRIVIAFGPWHLRAGMHGSRLTLRSLILVRTRITMTTLLLVR